VKLRNILLGIIAIVLLLIAATNIVDTRCSLAVASLDEPTWEEMRQADFPPGEYKRAK
jgi:hypothetical protein